MYVPKKLFQSFFNDFHVQSLSAVFSGWLLLAFWFCCVFLLVCVAVVFCYLIKLARLPSSIDESNSDSYHVHVSNFGHWHETRNDKSYIFCTWTASYPSTSGAAREGFFSLVLSLVWEDLQSFSSLLFRFWRQPSCQQNFGSLWWRSLKTTIFDDSACLKRTLRGRFREKILGLSNHLCFVPLCLVTGNGSRTFLSPSGFRFQFVCVWLCFLCPWFSTAWLSNTFQTSYADQLARKQLRAKKTIIKMVSIDIKDCVTYNVTKTAEETRKLKMPSKILRTK